MGNEILGLQGSPDRSDRWPVLRRVYGRYILGDVVEREGSLDACSGFEWDEANAHKNWERHRVSPEEAEGVFFNEPLVVRISATPGVRRATTHLGKPTAGIACSWPSQSAVHWCA